MSEIEITDSQIQNHASIETREESAQIEEFTEQTQIAEGLQTGEITDVDQEAERVAIESEEPIGDPLELSAVAEPAPEEEKVKPADDEPKKPKTIVMPIKRALTIEEKDRIANKMTEAIDAIKDLEAEKKAVAKDYASRIEARQKTLEHYSEQYKTNSITEQVEVTPVKNYELKVWQYFEVGSEKLVHETPFKSRDYQTTIIDDELPSELPDGTVEVESGTLAAAQEMPTEEEIEEAFKSLENAAPIEEESKSYESEDATFDFAAKKSEQPSEERIERAIEIVTQGYAASLNEAEPGGDVSIEQSEIVEEKPKKRSKKLFGLL